METQIAYYLSLRKHLPDFNIEWQKKKNQREHRSALFSPEFYVYIALQYTDFRADEKPFSIFIYNAMVVVVQ